MSTEIKKIISVIKDKTIKEILEDHLTEIKVDSKKKIVKLTIDRKYALIQLESSNNIEIIKSGVHKIYGEEYDLILKIGTLATDRHHDREINIPHNIHF